MFLHDYIGREYSSYEDLKENYQIKIPENFNFAYDVVDRYAREEPSREALVWTNDSGEVKRITFAQMKEQSDRCAAYFASLGIGKGDAVLLILRRRYEFWYALLALHKLGAIACPATHLLMVHDLEYRYNAAGIKMVVTIDEKDLQDRVDEAVKKAPTVKTLVTIGADRPGWENFHKGLEAASPKFARPTGAAAAGNQDIMLLYFTSGTTGNPKMVQHNFAYPLGHIITAKYWHNVTDGGLHLTVAETGWAKAMWGKIYGQWLAGSAVFVYDMDAFVPERLLEKVAEFKITTFCAPPTIYRYMIKEDLKKYDLSALRYCTIAGEPLNPEVYNKFLEITGIKLFEAYGQTELTIVLGNFTGMEPKPGSMGKPSPGYDLDIVRHDGTSCDTGEVGEIIIRIDRGRPFGMFAGYYRDDELTAAAFEGGIYHTGDTAWRDEDGYYWFVGRTDDIIKSSGYRIGPFEVESAMLTHPAVLECAITAVPDPDRGQIVKATVVLTKGYTASEELVKELQNHVKHATAPYKYPRVIEFVTELPKTISGKIRRVEIRENDTK
jgi:acetyl-CoA synthetase